jgi:hypothetical protein
LKGSISTTVHDERPGEHSRRNEWITTNMDTTTSTSTTFYNFGSRVL